MGQDYSDISRVRHEQLAERAGRFVDQMRRDWAENRKIESYAIAWLGHPMRADDGATINEIVMMALADTLDFGERTAALHRLIDRTRPVGVAIIERHWQELRVLFETRHGARAWLVPLERHGDIFVPKDTIVRDNQECLGLLWRVD